MFWSVRPGISPIASFRMMDPPALPLNLELPWLPAFKYARWPAQAHDIFFMDIWIFIYNIAHYAGAGIKTKVPTFGGNTMFSSD